jgi:2-C-methyl-D-erythritol 2,4-cyclodiphosphate synthase
MSIRIGHGFDVHGFGPGEAVVLGGVSIPHSHGLRAHSDGDVVLHALCDALLGAIAGGDIGKLFPDSDPAWADADSRALLREVVARIHAAGFVLGNADITVLAQAPRIGPHADSMRECIAEDLGASAAQVSVKATTTEGLGFVGRGEGIAVHAVVLLESAA